MRGDSEGGGALVESAKRSGCEASSAGRRDMCARMEEALRASTVLEYNIWNGEKKGKGYLRVGVRTPALPLTRLKSSSCLQHTRMPPWW